MPTITVSGPPGAGTSTLCKLLEKALGLQYIYAGQLYRNMAREHGTDLVSFGRYCEEHPEVDERLDRTQLDLLRLGEIILEGRVSGWMAHSNNIPAFKVFVGADERERAARVSRRDGGSIEERMGINRERERSEARRYMNMYGFDVLSVAFYDLVLDSTHTGPEELKDMVISAMYREAVEI